MAPSTSGIVESALYVEDLTRSVRFYEDIFDLRVIADRGGRGESASVTSVHVRAQMPGSGFLLGRSKYFSEMWHRSLSELGCSSPITGPG